VTMFMTNRRIKELTGEQPSATGCRPLAITGIA
jgi:hypothetical protein